MFRELAPLLRQRAVLLTLTHLEDDEIRVNIIPKQIATGENAALTTPFSITGTATELDGQLPQAIVDFVAKHLEIKNTLEAAKAEMDAAAKAAKEEARSKSSTAARKQEPAQPKSEPKSEPLKPVPPPSLFDPSPAATSAEQDDNPSTDEEEILKEINDRERDHNESDLDGQDETEDHIAAA